MITIWKYQFAPDDVTHIDMPMGARILKFDVQEMELTLWALVNTENKIQTRSFYLYGTGHNLGDIRYKRHIGSVQWKAFVWHLFEYDFEESNI